MEPVTTKEWFFILLLLAIPLVNIIFLIIYATNNNVKPSLTNYARAILLWFAVGFGLAILLGILSAILGT